MKHFPISSTKNSDDLFFLFFLVISSFRMFQPFQTLQIQLHNQLFSIIHSLNVTLFNILFCAFPLFLFEIYNYNCTIPILQLQATFYSYTNCHQLHVKICPHVITLSSVSTVQSSESLSVTWFDVGVHYLLIEQIELWQGSSTLCKCIHDQPCCLLKGHVIGSITGTSEAGNVIPQIPQSSSSFDTIVNRLGMYRVQLFTGYRVPGIKTIFYRVWVPSTGYLTNQKKWKKSKPSICLVFLIQAVIYAT